MSQRSWRRRGAGRRSRHRLWVAGGVADVGGAVDVWS
jgi:hypothetical protein